ncbi:hypothetical protein A0H81_04663 [Grifola frondosa]|uniref:Uncharacterized protein n=1 Tax=Grifola frondosa TaxID=5627 RepID=A0A1C7MFA6_GRIFR|nr:hypothetical protein A0H81_04663 [Grifola frondosa]
MHLDSRIGDTLLEPYLQSPIEPHRASSGMSKVIHNTLEPSNSTQPCYSLHRRYLHVLRVATYSRDPSARMFVNTH